MGMGTVLGIRDMAQDRGIRVDLDMAPVDLAVLDMGTAPAVPGTGREVRECSATSVKNTTSSKPREAGLSPQTNRPEESRRFVHRS